MAVKRLPMDPNEACTSLSNGVDVPLPPMTVANFPTNNSYNRATSCSEIRRSGRVPSARKGMSASATTCMDLGWDPRVETTTPVSAPNHSVPWTQTTGSPSAVVVVEVVTLFFFFWLLSCSTRTWAKSPRCAAPRLNQDDDDGPVQTAMTTL